jgi:hypothetical protein
MLLIKLLKQVNISSFFFFLFFDIWSEIHKRFDINLKTSKLKPINDFYDFCNILLFFYSFSHLFYFTNYQLPRFLQYSSLLYSLISHLYFTNYQIGRYDDLKTHKPLHSSLFYSLISFIYLIY